MDFKASKVLTRFTQAQVRKNTEDFTPDLSSLLALEEIIVPLARAQKNLTRAYTLFVKLKTPKVTPDGMIGGRGFMISFKDIKDGLNGIIDQLSGIIDAVDDEVTNNPIWRKVKEKSEEENTLEDSPDQDISEDMSEEFPELEDTDQLEGMIPENQFEEELEEESHSAPEF